MKLRTKFMVAFLCVALLLTLPSCHLEDDAPSISLEEEALQKYQQACETLAQTPDMTVRVEYALSRTVGGEIYSEQMTETIVYRGLGTADAAASVKQEVVFGPYET